MQRTTSSQIAWADIINMIEQLHPASWKNAVFLASPSTIPQLYNMTTSSAQISGMNVFSAIDKSHAITSLVGIPLILTEKVPALGSMGDIVLADFTQYGIAIRNMVEFEASSHEYFRRNLTSFRAIARLDGQPLWPSAMNLRDGTQVSPFVALDA